MASLLERELVVVTGKGGAGKSTISGALGLLAAERGLHTIVVELGEQARLPELFGLAGQPGVETKLQEGLWSISIDPDRAMLEWLQALGGRVSGRLLASSTTFQYFAAAAPGAKEMVSMIKVWELTQRERRRRRASYDLVVLDGPATGHALGLLHSPQTFGAIARVGPVAGQARQVRALLEDPEHSGYVLVAQGTEMAVTETLELSEGLERNLAREPETVIINGLLPQRFTAAELDRIAQISDGAGSRVHAAARPTREGEVSGARTASEGVVHSAALAALAVHARARSQHNQLARLRRRNFDVIAVPFVFTPELDLAAVHTIARRLGRRL